MKMTLMAITRRSLIHTGILFWIEGERDKDG